MSLKEQLEKNILNTIGQDTEAQEQFIQSLAHKPKELKANTTAEKKNFVHSDKLKPKKMKLN
jgi:hypothetical protein